MATDPRDEPAAEVIQVVLSGLANGTDLDDIAPQVAALASEHSLFPGDALIDLAADIIEASGATREHPIDTTDIRRRLLPEDRAHTKAHHQKAEFAIRAAAMVRAGVDPALDDTVSWWRANDLWLWALQAVAVYARAAAEHADVTVADICERVAARHDITL
jgi:hypothetical protein